MERMVDSLGIAYEDFIAAATNVLEAKGDPNASKSKKDTALENFKLKWELFKVVCDQAEEFVDSVKKRAENNCQVDEILKRVASGQATSTSRPPVAKKKE